MPAPGDTTPSAAPNPGCRLTAAWLEARAAEMVQIVMRHAEAGDRSAMRLCLKHGLAVGPPPPAALLAACRAAGREDTVRAIAVALDDGRINAGDAVRLLWALRRPAPAKPAGAQVIALADAQTRRRAGDLRRSAAKGAGAIVSINENTMAAAATEAARRASRRDQRIEITEKNEPDPK